MIHCQLKLIQKSISKDSTHKVVLLNEYQYSITGTCWTWNAYFYFKCMNVDHKRLSVYECVFIQNKFHDLSLNQSALITVTYM